MLRNDSKRVLSSAARSLWMCMHLGSHMEMPYENAFCAQYCAAGLKLHVAMCVCG